MSFPNKHLGKFGIIIFLWQMKLRSAEKRSAVEEVDVCLIVNQCFGEY